MSNFSYLSTHPEYSMFASAAIEAEKVFSTSPAMCAVGCRKALELAVKWVYAADKTITMPYKDNLQSLLHEESFRFAVDKDVWSVLPSIVKAGNLAVHTGHSVSAADAVFSLRGLFDFIQWVDYCYGTDYVESSFDETAIPGDKVELDTRKIREQESLLEQKDAELEALRKQVESLSAAYTAGKQQNQQCRTFTAADLTEAETRQKIIDIDLKAMGWKFTGADADVRVEYEVDNMNGVLGQKGYADYVLMGKDGKPLAVIEAKRSTKDPNIGRKQAQLYADCLEQKFGRRPMLFTTNGYTTYFWDEASGPQRPVSGVFCKDDLQKLMNRRTEKKPLDTIEIDDKITDRYDQKNAIRAVCAHITRGGPAQPAGHGHRHRQDPHGIQSDRRAEPGRPCDECAVSGRPHRTGQAGQGRFQEVSARPVPVQPVLLQGRQGGAHRVLHLSHHAQRHRQRQDEGRRAAVFPGPL